MEGRNGLASMAADLDSLSEQCFLFVCLFFCEPGFQK